METSISLRNCQTLPVPRQSRGFSRDNKVQFSLLSLLEYVTVCNILLSASSVLGIAASVALILMALALWMKRRFIALLMWMTASLVAGSPWNASLAGSTLLAQLTSIAIAGGLVAWYCVRRHLADHDRTGIIGFRSLVAPFPGPSEELRENILI